MDSSSDDELPLAQTVLKASLKKPPTDEVAESVVEKAEKEDVKVDVGAGLNGSGAAVKHNDKVKDEPEGDVKPPPETKRKKSNENGAKGKEDARSKKEKKEPKVDKTKAKAEPKAEPKKKSDSAKVTKPKVQYDMPGQTQPTPNKGEPLARFYISLREQRPNSEIANKWCVQRGLVSQEEAEAWLKKNGKASAARDSGRSPSKPRAPAARKPAAKKSTDKPKTEARKPAKKPPASSKKTKQQRDTAFDSDEYNSASSSEEEDDDEYEEIMPTKSKRVNKTPGRASSATNGKAKEHKKRKRKESESEGENSDDDDVPIAQRKKSKGSSVAHGSPGGASEEELTAADGESSDDELPLAQRSRKVAA